MAAGRVVMEIDGKKKLLRMMVELGFPRGGREEDVEAERCSEGRSILLPAASRSSAQGRLPRGGTASGDQPGFPTDVLPIPNLPEDKTLYMEQWMDRQREGLVPPRAWGVPAPPPCPRLVL